LAVQHTVEVLGDWLSWDAGAIARFRTEAAD